MEGERRKLKAAGTTRGPVTESGPAAERFGGNPAEGTAVSAVGRVIAFEPGGAVGGTHPGKALDEVVFGRARVGGDDEVAGGWGRVQIGSAIDDEEVTGAKGGKHAFAGDFVS